MTAVTGDFLESMIGGANVGGFIGWGIILIMDVGGGLNDSSSFCIGMAVICMGGAPTPIPWLACCCFMNRGATGDFS